MMKVGSLSRNLWEELEVRKKTTRFSEESDGKLPGRSKSEERKERRRWGKYGRD